MSNRMIVFLYSQYQNDELTQSILNLIEEYDLGFTSIQVDSPESRNIIANKIQETPAFIVKTGNVRKDYYGERAYDFIKVVVKKHPERKVPVPVEREEEEVVEPIHSPPPITKKSKKKKKSSKSQKNHDIVESTTSLSENEDLMSKWENEMEWEGIGEGSEGGNDYIPSESESNGDGDSDDSESDAGDVTVVYEEKPNNPAKKLAEEMMAAREDIIHKQFPSLKK